MRFAIDTEYAADPDTVVGIRLDPAFLSDVAERIGAVEHTVDVTPADGGGGRSVVRRTAPTDEFPDFARRFVGETLVIVEEVEWGPLRDGQRKADARMHAEGFPVGLVGRIELVPTSAGCLERATGDITAKVPLVGKRIEKAVEPALRDGLVVQAQTVREWLSR